MIITKLIGGLGNQMFQYAAGLSLAQRNTMRLRVDTTALQKYRRHQGYQLETIFSGPFQKATSWDLYRVLGLHKRKIIKGSLEIIPEWKPQDDDPFIRQPTHNFWPDFDEVSRSCYLGGYWQSPKYFANVQEDVRGAFSFRAPMTEANAAIAVRMAVQNSVSLHIRRGDYVSNPKANQFHGVCGWDYYERAMTYLQDHLPDAHFYAFSDDPELVKAHFQNDDRIEVVDINSGAQSYRDMQLMTHCQHHVIANSSFSWWGAWLADRPNKKVVAPRNWFAGSEEAIVDIYEPDWVRL